jgi:hypothetical protein
MRQSIEFYDERAREAGLAAKEAVLENVKERNLRAEQKWLKLASQARAGASLRAEAKPAPSES